MTNKVISCSQFFQELDLLEIKLHTLDSVVDYFVISESTKTHSGLDKPLYFEENKDRFKEFEYKIIHQVIRDTPSDYTNLEHNGDPYHDHLVDKINSQKHWDKNVESYGRDSWEKESLVIPLLKMDLPDKTIVLLSDLDEIAKPDSLKSVLDNFDSNQVYHMQHDVFYYYLNVRKNEPWYGTIVTSLKNFKENSFCTMRQNKRGIFVENGGWHFTFLKKGDSVLEKINSYGEQSLNKKYIKDNIQDNIENCLSIDHDLFFRPCKFWLEPISYETHPKYLVENRDKFEDYIYAK